MIVYNRARHVPFFHQLEATDCGPTCIQMIAAYYGKHYSVKTIKQFCDVTKLGISLHDLVNSCKMLGFETASVTLSISDAHRMPLPAILYYKRGHFVILESVKEAKRDYEYTIIDPDYGRAILTEESLVEKWMAGGFGIAVVLSPSLCFNTLNVPNIKEPNIKREIQKVAKSIFRAHRLNLSVVAFLSLFVVVTNWAMPLLLKATIDEGIMKKDISIVWGMLAAQFMFFIGFMISNNITGLLSTKTSIKVNLNLVLDYFSKIINIPMRFFDISIRTDLIQRISDLGRIETFITNNLLSVVLSILNLVVFSIFLLYYNILSFLIFAGFSVASYLYNAYFMRKRKDLNYATFSVNAERQNVVYELIKGMPEIKINNAQHSRISVWRQLEDKLNILKLKSLYLGFYMSNGANLIARLRDIALTALCAIFVINDKMSIGTMMMISFLLGQLTGPVGQLIGFTRSLQDAKLSFQRVNEIYEKPDEVPPNAQSLSNIQICEGIKFKDVSFKYAGSEEMYVLNNINLFIPKGKVTAIVGASGSGKTTLLKLLLGFYTPQIGEIFIDGYRMSEINLNTWRDKCGVVMQDGKIYSGSIAENIAFSQVEADINKLKYAAQIACIDKRIQFFPMGFYTRIGETGLELSGGERQRIFVARAVYRNPDFFFLDEATSSLDANTEKQIMKNLQVYYKDKTVVIIAHRLSTVRQADNIVFMESGSIVEQGTHEDLLKKRGHYFRLVSNQLNN